MSPGKIDGSTCEQFGVGRELEGPGFRVRHVEYGAGFRQRPHAHPWTGITLVLAGRFRETVHGREEEASALSVVVKPAGTVHADQVGPGGARTVAVEITDERRFLGGEGELGSWRWLHSGPGVRSLLGLQRALVGPETGDGPEELVLELLGEMADGSAAASGDVPGWVRRVREALDDEGAEGVGVRALAERANVHPVSLTRAFRRAYGVPVTTYRRRARLRRAAAEVVGSDRSLSAIAHAVGYADHAHMCREVRRTTGLTPSDLRRMARD